MEEAKPPPTSPISRKGTDHLIFDGLTTLVDLVHLALRIALVIKTIRRLSARKSR